MSTHLHGWLEINTINHSTEDLWFGVMDISVIVSQSYSIYGYLFGFRHQGTSQPLAPQRGLPDNSSRKVKEDIPITESFVSHSWISYQELEPHIANLELDEYDWGWQLVFNVMDELSVRYGKSNVRLVVGFDNYG
jgi:hypothetical protein